MMKISEHTAALEAKAAAKTGAVPVDDGATRHDVAFVGHPDGDYRFPVRVLPSGYLAIRNAQSVGATLIYDLTGGKLIKSRDSDQPPSEAEITRMKALPIWGADTGGKS